MKLGTIISSILAAATISLSPLALAGSLSIYNFTDYPSTTRMDTSNNKSCSTQFLGANGVTQPHTPVGSPHIVTENSIKAACIFHAEDCDAYVLRSATCEAGTEVAKIKFSVTRGVLKIDDISPDYCVRASGFTVVIDNKGSDTCK